MARMASVLGIAAAMMGSLHHGTPQHGKSKHHEREIYRTTTGSKPTKRRLKIKLARKAKLKNNRR